MKKLFAVVLTCIGIGRCGSGIGEQYDGRFSDWDGNIEIDRWRQRGYRHPGRDSNDAAITQDGENDKRIPDGDDNTASVTQDGQETAEVNRGTDDGI